MTSFYFTIVSRRPWANKLVRNPLFLAKQVKWMRSACFLEVSKFKAIIRLYDFWSIAKMFDGHFDKFHTGVGRLLAESVDKTLPTGFVNDRVLIELVGHSPYIAGFWNIFHIELPFYAQIFRRIVRLWHVCFLLCWLALVKALLSKKTKKGA